MCVYLYRYTAMIYHTLGLFVSLDDGHLCEATTNVGLTLLGNQWAHIFRLFSKKIAEASSWSSTHHYHHSHLRGHFFHLRGPGWNHLLSMMFFRKHLGSYGSTQIILSKTTDPTVEKLSRNFSKMSLRYLNSIWYPFDRVVYFGVMGSYPRLLPGMIYHVRSLYHKGSWRRNCQTCDSSPTKVQKKTCPATSSRT